MSAILPTSAGQHTATAFGLTPGRRAPASAPVSRAPDRLDLSDRARLLGLGDIRRDLVAQVRAEIAAGRYETEERLEGAIAALAEDLGSGA